MTTKLQTLKTAAHAATMNSYTPYIIAGAFVALTALLTLLLTLTMGNKAELEQILARQAQEPILVRARKAFGQETPLQSVNTELPDLAEAAPSAPVTTTETEDSAEGVIEYNKVATVQDSKIEILHQPVSGRTISTIASYHMETQFRFLEDRYKPVFSSAAYERMINRRRESFDRMMRNRS